MEVLLKPSAEKDLNKLPKKLAEKISLVIAALKNNPFPVGCQKLSAEDDIYRVRVGNYRVVYFWDKAGKKLLVTRIRHRREVYR